MADEPVQTTEPTAPEAAAKRPLSLLASEMFRGDFHGEVKKPEETSQETSSGADTEDGQTDESDDQTASAAAEDASEAEETTEQAETEQEQPISSVSELVQHLEADPEWFDTLKTSVKVDGQAGEVTLKELKDSYQIQQAAEHRLEEAKTKAKTIVQQAHEQAESLQSQFAVAAKLIENVESLLDKESKSIDWKKLREDDPAEYSARKAEIAERRETIEKMKRDASREYEQSTHKQREEMRNALQQHLMKEHNALLEKLPEWREEEKAKAGKAKLAEYLTSQGFSQQDVQAASDHRLILMARKAMLFDEQQAKTNAAKKKVAKVPKVLKPGAPKPKEQVNKERLEKHRAKLRKTGSLDDAYALLRASRGGN